MNIEQKKKLNTLSNRNHFFFKSFKYPFILKLDSSLHLISTPMDLWNKSLKLLEIHISNFKDWEDDNENLGMTKEEFEKLPDGLIKKTIKTIFESFDETEKNREKYNKTNQEAREALKNKKGDVAYLCLCSRFKIEILNLE